jgi:predicted transcriptional regulator
MRCAAVDGRGPTISEAELAVLKVLWDRSPATVRDVGSDLEVRGERRRAYTTVQTLLQRLEAKGYVVCDKSAAVNVYRAAVTRDELLGRRLRELAQDLCEGTASPLLMALVEGGRLSRDDLRRCRELLDQLDPPRRGRPQSG